MSVGAVLLGGSPEDIARGFCSRASAFDSINQFILRGAQRRRLLHKAFLWHFSICSGTPQAGYLNALSKDIESSNKE